MKIPFAQVSHGRMVYAQDLPRKRPGQCKMAGTQTLDSGLEASEALRAVHPGLEKANRVWPQAESTALAVLLFFYVPVQRSEAAMDGTQSAGRLQEH